VVDVLACSSFDDILESLCSDGIFLVGQLQQFDLVHRRSGTVRELFGNIAPFQARHDVKPIWPDNAGHLLDRDIRISAEVGNVAGILLVGKDETNRVAVMLQCLVGAANSRLELLNRSHVFAVNRGRILQDAQNLVQVFAVCFESWSRVH
jgi:hypothetical protein